MPKPLYIICCESGTEDAYTGMASHFNVVDRIVARPPHLVDTAAGAPMFLASIPLRIVAVWRAEDADFDGEFQHEMRMTLLPKDESAILLSGPFLFLRDKPRHRTTITIAGFRADESGQLVLESRIKRPEHSDWLVQTYTVDLVVHPPDQEDPAPNEDRQENAS